jgi:hypothetical protein
MTSQPMPPPILPDDDNNPDQTRDEHVDSDGTPVGLADRDEDIRRSGGDPDEDEAA